MNNLSLKPKTVCIRRLS
uniref:Uncharacterized protein n=1 Tax=Solanum lycopersicum TaxID=4081 RepID=A0A3Q7FA93_SOLLC